MPPSLFNILVQVVCSTKNRAVLIRALKAIDTFKPDHVTLDAASACIRMGSEQAAFDYLMRLVSILKGRGNLTLTGAAATAGASSAEAPTITAAAIC